MAKKNRSIKVASILLGLTLATSCFVGGTFAKYATRGTGSDTARVAKFGVSVTATGETFAESYGDTAYEYVVSGTGIEKVVAPGTSKDMASIIVTGKPEVKVKVSYDSEVSFNDKWVDKDGNYYCPIMVRINNNTLKGEDYESIAEFKEAIEAKIAGYTKTYAPNTDLSAQGADTLKVSWSWAFEGASDENDTFLGDQAGEDQAPTIGLTVSAGVEQVQ